MKIRRVLGIDKRLFERLQAICEKEGFMRSSFINHIINQEIDLINSFDTKDERKRRKEKKVRFQVNIDEDAYNAIEGNKTQRIEKILDLVMAEYENGKQRY